MAAYRRRIKLIDLNKQWDVACKRTVMDIHTRTLYITFLQPSRAAVVQSRLYSETHRVMDLVGMANGADNDSICNGDEWAQLSALLLLPVPSQHWHCQAAYASFASFTGPGQFDCISTGRWRVQNALVLHLQHFAEPFIRILLFLVLSSESTTLRHQSRWPQNSLAFQEKES